MILVRKSQRAYGECEKMHYSERPFWSLEWSAKIDCIATIYFSNYQSTTSNMKFPSCPWRGRYRSLVATSIVFNAFFTFFEQFIITSPILSGHRKIFSSLKSNFRSNSSSSCCCWHGVSKSTADDLLSWIKNVRCKHEIRSLNRNKVSSWLILVKLGLKNIISRFDILDRKMYSKCYDSRFRNSIWPKWELFRNSKSYFNKNYG